MALGLIIVQYAAAQSSTPVGLIIDFGIGEPDTYCIETGGETLAGYDLLLRSGLPVSANHTSQGAAVCQIGSVGCPANDCFCDSPPNYWSYWHLQEGQWVYATAGAGAYQVQPGSVDAWVWGEGAPPDLLSPELICANPTSQDPVLSSTTNGEESSTPPEPGSPKNYLVFGILACILGVGLAWMVFKR